MYLTLFYTTQLLVANMLHNYYTRVRCRRDRQSAP